jgi:hypothetical protein
MNERIAVFIALFFIVGVIPVGAIFFIIRDANYRAKVRKGLIVPPPIVNKQEKDIDLPAYAPKGEVTFSPVPNDIKFPQNCIYCMKPSVRSENLEVSATHRARNVKYTGRMSLSHIPYCSQHADEVQTLRKLQYVIWGGVGLAGVSMLIFTPNIHILIALGVLFAAWLILTFVVVKRYPNFGKYGGNGILTSDNVILGLQVIPSIYTEQGRVWRGGITKIKLIFHNAEYAKLFAKENDTFSI